MPRERLTTGVRRDQITEATVAVMRERGVKGLSIAAVAHRVGLAPSALYRHFPSKDAMLDAVLDLMRERLHGAVALARAGTADPLEALRQLLERHTALIRQNQFLPRILLSDDYHVAHPERRQRLLGVFSGYLEGVAGIIRDGQGQGRIRSDVNARSLAILFLGLIQPAGVLWALSDGRFDVTRQVREAWNVYAQAIRAPGAPPPPVARRARRSAGRT